MGTVNILAVGDVCANIGCLTLQKMLPAIIERYNVDFTIVNGENALDGEGLDEPLAKMFFEAGADVITGGNHTLKDFSFRQKFLPYENVLRPANIPCVAGTGFVKLKKNGVTFSVLNMLGRENMRFVDSPFDCVDSFLPEMSNTISVIDFHAEMPEEKETLGLYVDGKASFVFGTHTHVQTCDEKILPNGTAYLTDVGFVGLKDSVIGSLPTFSIEKQKNSHSKLQRWVNHGEVVFSACLVKVDVSSRKTLEIMRIKEVSTI